MNIYFLTFICLILNLHGCKTYEGGIFLKNKLLNLGILGIKLGQYLYTDKFLLSEDVKKILEPLLSDNIIHSYDDTIKMLYYDKNYYTNIETIEEVIGSGSLAQVHICRLKNEPNEKYILKVAHPCIVKLENEINTLKSILNKISYFKNLTIDWNYFFENISIQIDFNNEANNITCFYNIYKDYERIEIPKLIYSHKYFMIMSYCEGKQINTIDKDSNEYNIAIKLIASSFIHTSYKYNIYHSDLHPGNILVKPNGNIILLDFGICCKYKTENICNEILYIYKKIYHIKDYNSMEILFKNIIVEENDKINYKDLILDFILKYDLNSEKILENIIEYCGINNLIVNSNLIYIILQITILENYMSQDSPTFSNKMNRDIFLRTLSYMKSDIFFMNDIEEYILKFYELEYENENNSIKRIL